MAGSKNGSKKLGTSRKKPVAPEQKTINLGRMNDRILGQITIIATEFTKRQRGYQGTDACIERCELPISKLHQLLIERSEEC